VIVREHAGALWLFDQADHGRLCGELAEAWGNPPFEAPPATVREAAGTHDDGWREWDRRPRLDPEAGRPHPYSRMPPADYREIWERGLRLARARGEEVGLLVSLHAMRFFSHKREELDRRLLARERLRQREAIRRLGYADGDPEALPEPYATWHEWMFFWDALSLFLCEGWPSPWQRSIAPVPANPSVEVTAERRELEGGPGGELLLSPNPFRVPIELVVVARTIPAEPYDAQAALDAAVAAAQPRAVRWRLAGEWAAG
jgi:hypothetical protein